MLSRQEILVAHIRPTILEAASQLARPLTFQKASSSHILGTGDINPQRQGKRVYQFAINASIDNKFIAMEGKQQSNRGTSDMLGEIVAKSFEQALDKALREAKDGQGYQSQVEQE